MPDLTATDSTSLDSYKVSLTAEQEAYKKDDKDGKYRQVKAKADSGVTQEVHEYVCPDGSVGWQAFVTAKIDGVEQCKSFGVGKESESRSHDWVELTEE